MSTITAILSLPRVSPYANAELIEAIGALDKCDLTVWEISYGTAGIKAKVTAEAERIYGDEDAAYWIHDQMEAQSVAVSNIEIVQAESQFAALPRGVAVGADEGM